MRNVERLSLELEVSSGAPFFLHGFEKLPSAGWAGRNHSPVFFLLARPIHARFQLSSG